MALEMEGQGVFEQQAVAVVYTGLGKVNAAHVLTRELTRWRCAGKPLPRVLNFGTAGSARFPTHALVACHRFIQRDIDLTGLGFAPGVTPFEDIPALLEFPPLFPDLPHGLCGSGDTFAQASTTAHGEVIDMEAYALAKVCHQEGAPFGCVKYITDGADHTAADDWQRNLPRAAAEFLRLYRSLLVA
jgi:adenosylhomocysteine nucleosidase